PVLRRSSGGGTVLQGPGCLNYSLILKIPDAAPLTGITETNRFVMGRHREALESIVHAPVEIQGHTDLTQGGLKFSGNAQRRKQRYLLFHGTFLLDMDIAFIEKILRVPAKQPAYRQNRSHTDFLTNLHVPSSTIKDALRKTWNATEELDAVPSERIEWLIQQKYATEAWTFKF
ncbi:MAG: lipoate--protein ligase family protein, partial [Armatimonadota bacterium]|nr:lipoate--protein ligase family protein [Armatimonadota bacterium]